jgi:hypothetical protein
MEKDWIFKGSSKSDRGGRRDGKFTEDEREKSRVEEGKRARRNLG